jgi:hypothetical protein
VYDEARQQYITWAEAMQALAAEHQAAAADADPSTQTAQN